MNTDTHARLDAVRTRLGELDPPVSQALRAVLDLHKPDPGNRCLECADADLTGQWRGDPWPCRTVVALLGIVP